LISLQSRLSCRQSGAKIQILDARPVRQGDLGILASQMALTRKRHRIGQRVDPLRRKPGVFRPSLPGFDDLRGQCQIAIDQIGLVLQSGKVDLKLQIGCGSPFGASRFRFEAQFSPGHFVAAWRKEPRHKMAVTKRAPWRRGVRRCLLTLHQRQAAKSPG